MLGRTKHIIQINGQRVKVKTQPGNWLRTMDPVIIPISIHSVIHNDLFKIHSMLNVVKNNVAGRITVLMCEGAHLQTFKLQCKDAEERIRRDTDMLIKHYSQYLKDCEVIHWNEFVNYHDSYNIFKTRINELYDTDSEFRLKVQQDASYIKPAESDMLEQCIYLMIASEKGYKFEFYPGSRSKSMCYINDKNSTKLTRINVTLRQN